MTLSNTLYTPSVLAAIPALSLAACASGNGGATQPGAVVTGPPDQAKARGSVQGEEQIRRNVLLPPKQGNPRNSEGDFIELEDGRLMFVYTHFTGGRGGDNDTAHLAARFSDDRGRTWTPEDTVIVPNHGGMNVMSVSLLRLNTGEIALFYLVKNSRRDTRPVMRLSVDEGKTWTQPTTIIPDSQIGYYVLNNDRVVQLESGRLVAPVASNQHIMTYLSDDNGRTWRRGRGVLRPWDVEKGRASKFQEPGVVELKDGRLFMWIRTDGGSQYVSYSQDGGETWSPHRPSNITSPLSPASIERIPKTGDLLMVWNSNGIDSRRTPFNVAISRDEGRTWENVKVLEDDPSGWYCYTAIAFVDDRVLLGHVAGNTSRGWRLSTTQITTLKVDWLYN